MEDTPTLEEEISEVICRLSPDLLDAYEILKHQYRQALADERKHFKGAQEYLKNRQAPPHEFENLRIQSEAEIRRIKNEFSASIRGLLYRFDCPDC